MSDIQPSSKFKGPTFKIDRYPPHDSAFCRRYPVVAGHFSLDLSSLESSIASLKSIEIGLKGHVRVGYSETRYSKIKKTVEKHTENHILFDQSKIVHDGTDADGMVQSEFRFEFPSDKKLPSTVTYKARNLTYHATVMYYLYAKLSLVVDPTNGKKKRKQKTEEEVIKEFHYPVVYQEDETPADSTGSEPRGASDCYSASFIWKNFSVIKPKSAKTLTDSLIRRKPKVMPKFRLQVTSDIPRTIDISKGFEQIPVCLEVSEIENIEDFIMDNQSTTLGRFTVEAIHINFFQGVYVTGKRYGRYNDYNHNVPFRKDYEFYRQQIQAIIDMADGQYNSEEGTLTYKTTLGKLFPSKSPAPSSFVRAFQGVPMASCSDSLPDSKLGFTNILEFNFLLKHAQYDMGMKPRKGKTRVWSYYSDRLRFQRYVDLAYRVDDSTPEGDLVNGLLVESGGTEIDLTSDLDESKVITVNSSLPKKVTSGSSTTTTTTTKSKSNTTFSYKYTSNSDSQTWMNNYILMTTMADDCGDYHHCYHSGCETTTTEIPVSSGGRYSGSGSGGYSGGDSGGYSGGDSGGGGGCDSGGGGGSCDF
ncbi:unnamed protein product [Ambrosiozyma monospora]|uniref:Unnamed protein product n=1 Tax=Ambrosiozyma monospora TaxID=43982 RepID=A0ACB5SSI1_AMBMO|nr:unnamed protein product [Ambrosiozyma monospora]